MNQEEISTIKHTISTNSTPVMEKDATTGMTNIWKDLWNNDFKWKICIYIDVTNGNGRMINSYYMHLLSNV